MSCRFNDYGGQYVPENILKALNELEEEYNKAKNDASFWDEYKYYLNYYTGRPSPLYYAENMTYDEKACAIFSVMHDGQKIMDVM